jgi:hypothetical protein
MRQFAIIGEPGALVDGKGIVGLTLFARNMIMLMTDR